MEEKCFCHLNGYRVKDSVARNSIEEVKESVNNLSSETQESINNLSNTTQQNFENINDLMGELETNINSQLGQELENKGIFVFKMGEDLPYGNSTSKTITSTKTLERAQLMINKMKELASNDIKNFTIILQLNWTNMLFHTRNNMTSSSVEFKSYDCYTSSSCYKFYQLKFNGNSDLSQITSIVLEQQSTSPILTTSYNENYSVYFDYTPAHKKYVDESIETAINGITPGEGGSIVIDSTPTEGSTNAVSSGGVKSYVDSQLGELNDVPVKTYLDGLEEDMLIAVNNTLDHNRHLLWENENTNVETFGPDTLGSSNTITCLDTLSKYTSIEIIYDTNQGVKSTGRIPLSKTSRYGLTSICMDAIRQGVVEGRQAYINDLSTTNIIFTNGFKFETYGTDTKSLETRACVPLIIYGYRDTCPRISDLEGGEE